MNIIDFGLLVAFR